MTIADAARRASAVIATVVEIAIVASSGVYVLTGSLAALIVWELMATVYLVVGFLVIRRRAVSGAADPGRPGFLDTLSWLLPLAASLVGINSAVLFLIDRSGPSEPPGHGIAFASAAAVGIVISWVLLHAGFAQMYRSSEARRGMPRGLAFPTTPDPGLSEYMYFSFTVGASFATSDTTVTTSRMRWTVLGHGALSFFYNALVVALAFQILQQLASS